MCAGGRPEPAHHDNTAVVLDGATAMKVVAIEVVLILLAVFDTQV